MTNADAEDFERVTLPGLLERLERQTTVLEDAAEGLQQAQARLSLPSPEEVAEIRSGERSMTRTAYLLARLQRHIVALENVASDLRTDLEAGFDPKGVDITAALFNALEAAVASPGPGRKQD